MDAVQTADTFGVSADRAVTYEPDSTGTEINFNAVSETVSCMRASRSVAADWKRDIENYRKNKKKR